MLCWFVLVFGNLCILGLSAPGRHMAAGGAATSLPVLQFFEDIGIPIMEGYGLTETSPIITLGTVDWSARRLGCVGVPIPGVTVRIVDPETLQQLPSDTDGEVSRYNLYIQRFIISTSNSVN
jgi:long-subunit acyl-CoA synthetase (AMP-forming)